MDGSQQATETKSGAIERVVTISEDVLFELGRATTVYYEAGPEHFEEARVKYEAALLRFKSSLELSQS